LQEEAICSRPMLCLDAEKNKLIMTLYYCRGSLASTPPLALNSRPRAAQQSRRGPGCTTSSLRDPTPYSHMPQRDVSQSYSTLLHLRRFPFSIFCQHRRPKRPRFGPTLEDSQITIDAPERGEGKVAQLLSSPYSSGSLREKINEMMK
jgi:hypothetical protein